MKPFNLERALAGDKVVTHDSPVIEIHVLDTAHEDQSVVAVVDCGDGQIYSEIFGKDGKRYDHEYCSAPLKMATTKRTVWVNVYKLLDEYVTPRITVYPNKHAALQFGSEEKGYGVHLGAFPLEIEE
jgi:tRNA A37 threonylcarbamoyladenosine modification protein TsaB